MTRTLPWKRREGEASQQLKPERPSPVHRVKEEHAVGSALDEADSALSSDGGKRKQKTLKRARQRTSTSPAPEPPQEKFMIEGLDGDDRYRMVEDEFLATAQQFTAHLHAAEYKRLKAASELENAQTIKNISRPVIGHMTNLVKTKRERVALGLKQRAAIQKARKQDVLDDESSDRDDLEESWQKQSLYGLMESPGKRSARIDGLPTATSITRAAAGYHRQATEAVSPSRPKSKAPSDSASRYINGTADDPEDTHSHRITHRSLQPMPRPSRVTAHEATEPRRPLLGNHNRVVETQRADQPGTMGTTDTSDDGDLDFMARLKKRQAERRRSREQRHSTHSKVKTDADDIVPDFL